MTLVELVISIVVVSIAVSAVLGVLSSNVEHSADAMVISQAVSIAEAYIEEISLKPFDDPDGIDGEASRADFDDVDDYDGLLDAGAVDQFGNPIPSLSAYRRPRHAAPLRRPDRERLPDPSLIPCIGTSTAVSPSSSSS